LSAVVSGVPSAEVIWVPGVTVIAVDEVVLAELAVPVSIASSTVLMAVRCLADAVLVTPEARRARALAMMPIAMTSAVTVRQEGRRRWLVKAFTGCFSLSVL